jgi:hemerythrin
MNPYLAGRVHRTPPLFVGAVMTDGPLPQQEQNGLHVDNINCHADPKRSPFKENFMTLHWDDRYKLGNEKIDAEHHIFLDLVVEFDSLVASAASKDRLVRTLREIEKYAEFHFLSEENLMIDCQYPDLDNHIKLHLHLIASLEDQLYRLKAGTCSPAQVFDFLFQWFALHTSSEDKKLVSYMESRTWRGLDAGDT